MTSPKLRFARVFVLLLATLGPRLATADEQALRVVWLRGDRAYVAAADSASLAPRMLVRFLDHGREIASGEVTRVLDGTLAAVRIASGAIEAGTKLERLGVLAQAPPPRPPARLRIGAPSAARAGLAFPCPGARLELGALPRAYRAETLSVASYRLVPADTLPAAIEWPETLLVRLFGDRADEEIALERGELDVAVFWPGEPSSRLRDGPLGAYALRGVRARGVLASAGGPADSSGRRAIAADLAAFNAEMFGGDLLPWASPDSAGGVQGAQAAVRPAVRHRVDAALPGQRVLERFLNRGLPPIPRPGERTSRLVLLDAPVSARDSLESAWRPLGIVPLFALRCPLFCAPDRAADVRALGADPLANLVGCAATGRRP